MITVNRDTARILAERFLKWGHLSKAQWQAVVLGRLMREQVLVPGDQEQEKLLHSLADLDLLTYEGSGEWKITPSAEEVLSASGREQLFAWVQDRVAYIKPRIAHGRRIGRFPDFATDNECVADDVMETLGLPTIDMAEKLCKAAGCW